MREYDVESQKCVVGLQENGPTLLIPQEVRRSKPRKRLWRLANEPTSFPKHHPNSRSINSTAIRNSPANTFGLAVDGDGQRGGAGIAVGITDGVGEGIDEGFAGLECLHSRVGVGQGVGVTAGVAEGEGVLQAELQELPALVAEGHEMNFGVPMLAIWPTMTPLKHHRAVFQCLRQFLAGCLLAGRAVGLEGG